MADVGENQMALLAVLYALPASSVSLDDLIEPTEIGRNQVAKAMGRLVMRGLAVRLDRGSYQITPDGMEFHEGGQPIASSHIHPLTGTRDANGKLSLRQRAWAVMRMGEAFDVDALASVASNDDDKRPRINLRRYVKALLQAGYIDKLPTQRRVSGAGKKGFQRYRLARNTGEIAPVYKWRASPPVLYDHNQKRAYELDAVSQMEAA